jgi:hypothetical protein
LSTKRKKDSCFLSHNTAPPGICIVSYRAQATQYRVSCGNWSSQHLAVHTLRSLMTLTECNCECTRVAPLPGAYPLVPKFVAGAPGRAEPSLARWTSASLPCLQRPCRLDMAEHQRVAGGVRQAAAPIIARPRLAAIRASPPVFCLGDLDATSGL